MNILEENNNLKKKIAKYCELELNQKLNANNWHNIVTFTKENFVLILFEHFSQ